MEQLGWSSANRVARRPALSSAATLRGIAEHAPRQMLDLIRGPLDSDGVEVDAGGRGDGTPFAARAQRGQAPRRVRQPDRQQQGPLTAVQRARVGAGRIYPTPGPRGRARAAPIVPLLASQWLDLPETIEICALDGRGLAQIEERLINPAALPENRRRSVVAVGVVRTGSPHGAKVTVPQIIVTAVTPDAPDGSVTLREWITRENLQSAHFANQLLQRLAWAVSDAHFTEQTCEAGDAAAHQTDDRRPHPEPRR